MSENDSDDVDRGVRELLKKDAMLSDSESPNLLKSRPIDNVRGGSTAYARRGRVRIHAGKKSTVDESDSDSELRAQLRREALEMAKCRSASKGLFHGPTKYARRGGKIANTASRKSHQALTSLDPTWTIDTRRSVKLLEPPNANFLKPLKNGWIREVVYRKIVTKSASADIYYTSPEGIKFRSGKEIERYFALHPEKKADLENDHFTFKRVLLGWDGPEEYERLANDRVPKKRTNSTDYQ